MITAAQQLYYAWDISHKKSTSDESKFTGVLSEARVDLNPHQVEAALFAFKSPLSKGAILADEVGLGKTIEAGIILSELWAEQRRHILIIVPASLRNQWNIELLEKFYLPSVIIERGSYELLSTSDKSPFDNPKKIIICSYNFAATYAEEISQIRWDLVVFDEAHKLRNVYKKDNHTANTLKKALKPYKKLLLTATPLQNNLKELYGLVSIIDDEFFSSVSTFDDQYNKISTRDESKYGELKSRISHIAHRTLRSQVQEYVKYTKRSPFVQEYIPTPKEEELYNKVNLYLQRGESFGIPDLCRALLTMLVRKILSSSAYALKFTLGKIKERLEATRENGWLEGGAIGIIVSDFEISSDEDFSFNIGRVHLSEEDKDLINLEIEELNECIRLAESIEEETKAIELLKGLNVAFDKIANLGGNRKALIFTESCRTQEYLASFLRKHGYEGRLVCFNGTNNSQDAKSIYKKWLSANAGTPRYTGNSMIDKKQALVDFFKSDAEIMIATESGAEGINLQFCSLVVNYDMPWNPQRIEQRIGRCHRYGQKHDVVVMNFVNKGNAADIRVYELLNNKFNLFDGVFGSSDEIIGSIDSAINLERRLNDIFQNSRTESEINAAFDELQSELESIITERIKQTRISLLENFDEDVVNKLKVRQGDDVFRVDNYIEHFWKLVKNSLDGIISDVNEHEKSFTLDTTIGDEIELGKYILNKECGDRMQLRFATTLGQWIIKQNLSVVPIEESVVFDVSSYPFRSMIIEKQKGNSGFLVAHRINAENSYDNEESIVFSVITENGEILPSEFGNKLLDLNAVSSEPFTIKKSDDRLLRNIFEEKLQEFKTNLDNRTLEYVNYEIEKYESWSEDKVVPLQNEVIELRKQKESVHRQIRKESNPKNKLLLKRQEIEIGDKLRKKQQRLFEAEDEYSAKVDGMTKKLLKAMENEVGYSVMFKMKWSIV